MKEKTLIYNPRGLYGKLIERITEIRGNIKGVPLEGFIPYSFVYEKLCRNFSIKKSELREILFFLRDVGILEISHVGIKLNYELLENE